VSRQDPLNLAGAHVPDPVVSTVTLRGTATTWDCQTGRALQVSPKPPDFPKRFGVCELDEEGGTLRMRFVSQANNVPK
jgi:hypothetical protein